MLLDAPLDFPDGPLDITERIDAPRQCKSVRRHRFHLQHKIIRRIRSSIVRVNPAMIRRHDAHHVDANLIRRIRQIGKPLVVGQVGVEPSRGMDWTAYDLMLSQLPRLVRTFRAAGVRAEVSLLSSVPTKARRAQVSSRSLPDMSAEPSDQR